MTTLYPPPPGPINGFRITPNSGHIIPAIFFFHFKHIVLEQKKAKTTDYLETCMFGFFNFLWRVTRSAQLPECTVTLNPVTHHINAHTDAQRGGRSQLLRC